MERPKKKRKAPKQGGLKKVKLYVRKAFQHFKAGDEISLSNVRVIETLMAKGLVTKTKPKAKKKKDATSKKDTNGGADADAGTGKTIPKG